MNVQDQTIFRCFRPRKIVNPYSKEVITTSCGRCPACLVRKGNKKAMLCSIEEEDHKYCMFVTLTYNEENIPRASFILHDGLAQFLDAKRGVTWQCEADKVYMLNLMAKCQNERIPYLWKRDVVLFLKRFRKNIQKYSNEKIRYYAVGEYGPIHFRPHFHLLFFFDQESTFENFAQALHSSWSLGRVDYSISRRKAASYVAKYVNSSVSVPRIFQVAEVCPFSSHSVRFAQQFYQSKKQEIYKDVASFACGMRRVLNGRGTNLRPWRSLESLFFPKCKGFDFKTYRKVLYANTALSTARKIFACRTGKVSITALSEIILHHLLGNDLEHIRLNGTSPLARLLLFFMDGLENLPLLPQFDVTRDIDLWNDLYGLENVSKWLGSIQRCLYHSKHFIEFVCDGICSYDVFQERTRMIMDYYRMKDYDNLTAQYDLQELLMQESCQRNEGDLDLVEDDFNKFSPFLYDNDLSLPRFGDIPLYNDFVVYSQQKLNESIKHKELNDLNNIFT